MATELDDKLTADEVEEYAEDDPEEESDEYDFEDEKEEGGYEDEEDEELEGAGETNGKSLTGLLLGAQNGAAAEEEEEHVEDEYEDEDAEYTSIGEGVESTSIPATPSSAKKRTLDDLATEETEGAQADDEGADGKKNVENGEKEAKKARV